MILSCVDFVIDAVMLKLTYLLASSINLLSVLYKIEIYLLQLVNLIDKQKSI